MSYMDFMIFQKRIDKYLVAEDNCLIYAKYYMSISADRLFMWMKSKVDSRGNGPFGDCTMNLWEVRGVLNHTYVNTTHIKRIIKEMSNAKINIDNTDIKIFDYIEYKTGEARIAYKLNDGLSKYLLNLKKHFTETRCKYTSKFKSTRSRRIYSMLMCEISQNRKRLKIEVEKLQDILCVPNGLKAYNRFNQKILQRAKLEINVKESNIHLLKIEGIRNGAGNKFTHVEFYFDYKSRTESQIKSNKATREMMNSYNNILKQKIDAMIGKYICANSSIHIHKEDKYNVYHMKTRGWNDEQQCPTIVCVHSHPNPIFRGRETKPRTVSLNIKTMSDIKKLEKLKRKAECLYLNDDQYLLMLAEEEHNPRSFRKLMAQAEIERRMNEMNEGTE